MMSSRVALSTSSLVRNRLCTWRTPILDPNGTRLDDAALRRMIGSAPRGGEGGKLSGANGGAVDDPPTTLCDRVATAALVLVVSGPQLRAMAVLAAVVLTAAVLLRLVRRSGAPREPN